ncbi:MAG: DNA starvation/stationary phase protection protein [Armatimonadetes bacterium]|nr:DNA starvation/stationary phase protection protein [Armatimonadota bacterium]
MKETTAQLQDTLTELISLSLIGKQAHWNLRGPQFLEIHELLDVIVESTRNFYDDVAERAVALGTSVSGQASAVNQSGIKEIPIGFMKDLEAAKEVVNRMGQVITNIRQRMEESGKTDPVTQDLYIEILRTMEKQFWLLRSHTL